MRKCCHNAAPVLGAAEPAQDRSAHAMVGNSITDRSATTVSPAATSGFIAFARTARLGNNHDLSGVTIRPRRERTPSAALLRSLFDKKPGRLGRSETGETGEFASHAIPRRGFDNGDRWVEGNYTAFFPKQRFTAVQRAAGLHSPVCASFS
jgi:hypothetical protein